MAAINNLSFGTVSQPTALFTPIPIMPSFSSEPIWDLATKYFKYLLSQKDPTLMFPRNFCLYYSQQLFLFLFVHYKGRFDELNNAHIQIEGKESLLILNNTNGHRYLELRLGEEKWIIDPTWKQLVAKKESSSAYYTDDPFNRRLAAEFPDILITKFDDLQSLMYSLHKEISNGFFWMGCHTDPDQGQSDDDGREHIQFVNWMKRIETPSTPKESDLIDEWNTNWSGFGKLPFSNISDLKSHL